MIRSHCQGYPRNYVPLEPKTHNPPTLLTSRRAGPLRPTLLAPPRPTPRTRPRSRLRPPTSRLRPGSRPVSVLRPRRRLRGSAYRPCPPLVSRRSDCDSQLDHELRHLQHAQERAASTDAPSPRCPPWSSVAPTSRHAAASRTPSFATAARNPRAATSDAPTITTRPRESTTLRQRARLSTTRQRRNIRRPCSAAHPRRFGSYLGPSPREVSTNTAGARYRRIGAPTFRSRRDVILSRSTASGQKHPGPPRLASLLSDPFPRCSAAVGVMLWRVW